MPIRTAVLDVMENSHCFVAVRGAAVVKTVVYNRLA
jgi:hypothetical protein